MKEESLYQICNMPFDEYITLLVSVKTRLKGLKLLQVAKGCGVSYPTLHNLYTGRTRAAYPHTLLTIKNYLDKIE